MFVALMALLLSVSATSPPDVKGFTPVLSKELEFRIDDYKTALVGRVVVYQNPDDPNEFVKVYYRQVAIVSERAQEKNNSETGSHDSNLSNFQYHSKQEAEVLGRVQQATDAFAYVQWLTVRDQRTGQDIQDGSFQIWLLDPNGVWVYYTQPAGKSPLNLSPFSEPSKDNPKNRINVGIEFFLAGEVHIIRIDQDDILTPVKPFNETQGKEADNDKK